MDFLQTLEKVTYKLLELAATQLPKKVETQLNRAIRQEKSEIGSNQLTLIAKNIKIAKELKHPLCQDTGLISFYIKTGKNSLNRPKIRELLLKVTKEATKSIPLRPNAVNFFEGNTGTNVGELIPWIYWEETTDNTDFELTIQLKGGGTSNISKLVMVNPIEGLLGIKKAVIEAVASAGAKGCPPYTIGIGLGGTEDLAMILAKKALLIPPETRNKQQKFAKLEIDLIQNLNQLKIGVMGLGYGPSILDVHILQAARHPGSLPVGISFSCWALRYATARLENNQIKYLTHEE